MRKIFIIALLAILLAACAPVTIAPTPSAEWTVRFIQSGGIMGMSRTIEISSDGKYSASDDRAERTVEGQLSASEISRLAGLVTEAAQLPAAKPNNGCADCFIYTIEMSGFGKPVQLQANDVSLPGSGLEPLIAFLQGVMERALK